MNTSNQDYIIDHVGADSWDAIVSEFNNKSLAEITATLNYMFPAEDNGELAQRIFDEIGRRPGAQPGNRNAAKPEYLKRVVYFNARLPQWLCDWLDGQPDRGRLIEQALIDKYNLTAPH